MMLRMRGVPLVSGYARVSSDEQEKQGLSLPDQSRRLAEKGQAKANELNGIWAGTRCEVDSADKIRWNQRREFKKLLQELKQGDHLFVTRFDRLERHPFPLIDCVRYLTDCGITLHVLDFPGQDVDTESVFGRAFLMFAATWGDYDSEARRNTTMAGLREARRQGRRTNIAPPLGKKFVNSGKIGGQRNRPIYYEEWDNEELSHWDELYRRFEQGETAWSIAKDFYHRGLKTATGHLWVKRMGKTKRTRRYSCRRILEVRKRIRQMIETDTLPPQLQHLRASPSS